MFLRKAGLSVITLFVFSSSFAGITCPKAEEIIPVSLNNTSADKWGWDVSYEPYYEYTKGTEWLFSLYAQGGENANNSKEIAYQKAMNALPHLRYSATYEANGHKICVYRTMDRNINGMAITPPHP